MSWGIRKAGGFVVAVILWGVAFTQPVFANHTANCNDLYQNRHSGLYLGGVKDGVRARLEGQGLDQCTGPGFPVEISGSFAFVNIQGTDENDIVQIGIGRCRKPFSDCNSAMRVYWAWGRDSSTPGCQFLESRGPAPELVSEWDGAGHDFSVTYSGSTYRVYMDGSQKKQATICWTSKASTWFTESWDVGDSIGGLATNKFRISSMKTRSTATGLWSNTSFNASSSCNLSAGNPYKCDIVSGTAFDTWTAR